MGSGIKARITNIAIILLATFFCLSVLLIALALILDSQVKGSDVSRPENRFYPGKRGSGGGKQVGLKENAAASFPASISGYSMIAESIEGQISMRTYMPTDGGSKIETFTATISQYGSETEAAEAIYQLRYTYWQGRQLIWLNGTMSSFGTDTDTYAAIGWAEGDQAIVIKARVKAGNSPGSLLAPLLDIAREF